jgi:hypothetical protein
MSPGRAGRCPGLRVSGSLTAGSAGGSRSIATGSGSAGGTPEGVSTVGTEGRDITLAARLDAERILDERPAREAPDRADRVATRVASSLAPAAPMAHDRSEDTLGTSDRKP